MNPGIFPQWSYLSYPAKVSLFLLAIAFWLFFVPWVFTPSGRGEQYGDLTVDEAMQLDRSGGFQEVQDAGHPLSN